MKKKERPKVMKDNEIKKRISDALDILLIEYMLREINQTKPTKKKRTKS